MKFVKGQGSSIHDALEQGRKIIKKAKIGQSELESELILSAAINKPREFIYTHPNLYFHAPKSAISQILSNAGQNIYLWLIFPDLKNFTAWLFC